MKRYIFFGSIMLLLGVLVSCEQGSIHSPITQSNNIPEPVSNVKVKRLHGGAKISYSLPNSGNMRSVKAVVKGKDGFRKVKEASSYNRKIRLKGLPDTTTYKVKLYTVNRAGNESKPVAVKVKPLTPPILYVFNSLTLNESFGGAKITFQNKYRGKVKIAVITKDPAGNLKVVDAYYTQAKQDTFYVTGFSPEKRRFGVYVRNQWGFRSDTLYKHITPIREQKVPKQGFEEVHLPTDSYKQNPCCGGRFDFNDLWDGVIHEKWNGYASKPGTSFPQWFTIDLGTMVKLDRFKLHSRYSAEGNAGVYSLSDPRVIILWGSKNPDGEGEFDNTWIKLGRFVDEKPSGSPPGEFTQDDLHYATVEGKDFRIPNPLENPAVRYIRFETVDTWTDGQGNGVVITELTFWGEIVKDN